MEEYKNVDLEQLKKYFYANRLYPIEQEDYEDEYREYCNAILERYFQKPKSTYFDSRFHFAKWEWVYSEREKRRVKKNMYQKDTGTLVGIILRFEDRIKRLTYKLSYVPYSVREGEPKNKYERQVYTQFSKRLKEKNVPSILEDEANKKVKEILLKEVKPLKEIILKHLLDKIEERFKIHFEELESTNTRILHFNLDKEIYGEIYKNVELETIIFFNQIKQELIKKIL